MSWPEVKKINSDFMHEPLNFNNYINDISTFGKYSYVLDPENSKLWRSLLRQSLTMFGHNAIHETVYERLTDDDVDYMIRHNARLGQAFNSFYNTSAFPAGVINTILKTLTSSSYTLLELKLQNGINRYVSEMTSGDTAGEWLGTVFEVDALKEKTDMASIISDSTLWNNTVMTNEPLRFAICISAGTIDWFANNESDAYIDFITEVCNSTKSTMDLFTILGSNDKLTTFMETESVVSVMTNKYESMVAVTYMIDPFAAMIASETAMTAVVSSETAMNVIIDSITNAINSETVLNGIKGNLTSIEESLPNIANTEPNITEVVDVKDHITDVVVSLQTVTSQTNVLIANIDALIASETAMTAIASNETVVNRIFQNESIFTIIASNETSMRIACESNVFRKAMYDNADLTVPIITSSDSAIMAMKNSTRFYTASTGYYSSDTSGSDTGMMYEGPAFVFRVYSNRTQTVGSQTITFTHGKYLPGDTFTVSNFRDPNAYPNCFASSVVGSNTWSDTISIYADIFKI